MVHGIVAARERFLLEIDAIEPRDFPDGRKISRQADEAGAERSHIGLELGRRVALRIDGDEQGHDLLRLWSKLVERVGHQAQRGRADVRADRKSTRLNSSHPSISYAVFC